MPLSEQKSCSEAGHYFAESHRCVCGFIGTQPSNPANLANGVNLEALSFEQLSDWINRERSYIETANSDVLRYLAGRTSEIPSCFDLSEMD